jgi:DNA-binding LacI/PurR family transcriptional regulator
MKSPVSSTTQLARLLGLSRWTVSRALNGHAGVDPKTAERIKEAARQAGFSPSLLGSGLRTGRTNLVGICLPDLVDYFLTTKISLLQEALRRQGLHPLVQIVSDEEDENAAVARFAAMRCAGVVMIASRLDDRDPGLRTLETQGIPFVRIDPLKPQTTRSIATDRRRGISDAMAALHEAGHRSLVAAGFSEDSSYGRQRVAGLRDGCRALGWKFSRDVRILAPPEPSDDFDAGTKLGAQYLELRHRGSAILAINDRVAFSLMQVLQSAGLRLPRDVSVIGYDNADFSAYTSPALSTIDPGVPLLIREAVSRLESPGPARAIKPTLIPPLFVPRASLAPPPRAAKK